MAAVWLRIPGKLLSLLKLDLLNIKRILGQVVHVSQY